MWKKGQKLLKKNCRKLRISDIGKKNENNFEKISKSNVIVSSLYKNKVIISYNTDNWNLKFQWWYNLMI